MAGSEEYAITEQMVEEALDNTIGALMVLDSPLLAQLSQLWGAWEVTPFSLSISHAERERLQAKLALLVRLLQQTAANLSLLGVPACGYKTLFHARGVAHSFENLQRGA